MKVKYSIYEISKFDVEVDTEDIDMDNQSRGTTYESMMRRRAYYLKGQLRNTDSKIIYTACLDNNQPSEMVEIHKKI